MNIQLPIKIKAKHPLGPKIIFSYGMTKCGSTLAFELARSGLELQGFPQPQLLHPALVKSSRINFARHLQPSDVATLWEKVQMIGHPIVIKTHTRPDPAVIDLIAQGHALVQATYRDPREMALSMMDNGARNRIIGKRAFTEITNLQTARENISSQVDSLTQWLIRPNCLPLYFEDLAFRTERTTRTILAQLKLEISAKQVRRHVQNKRFTQLNKGLRKRYKNEMSREEQRHFQSQFAPFYEHLIQNRSNMSHMGDPILKDGTVLVHNS